MMNTQWIDVSATISDGMTCWPTDQPVKIYKTSEIGKNGGVANVTAISSTAHLGTHIDAPLHFIASGNDIASIPLGSLIGDAKVFTIKNETSITLAEIKDFPIEESDRVLFKTRNSDVNWETQPFMADYVYLGSDAAEYLARKNVICVGIDYLSIGGKDNNPHVHKTLLGQGIIIIEGLKLAHIQDGNYQMICMPLKIQGSDGSPSRVALKPL